MTKKGNLQQGAFHLEKGKKLEWLMAVILLSAAYVLSREGARLVAAQKAATKVVVLDSGHGGDDPGKIGANGVKEKDINLAIARLLKKKLEKQGILVVMTREGDKVLLTLKPEQRHLVSDKARADLAEIIGPALGQPVQVEVTLGVVPDKETPLEIEHRLYLGVREQVTRDLEQDPNVQFLVQRFGAVLHHESIEPLNR